MEKPTPYMTKRDVAAWLRVRPERIDVLIREHGFPVTYLPTNRKRETLRFSRSSLEAWLKSKEEFLPE